MEILHLKILQVKWLQLNTVIKLKEIVFSPIGNSVELRWLIIRLIENFKRRFIIIDYFYIFRIIMSPMKLSYYYSLYFVIIFMIQILYTYF